MAAFANEGDNSGKPCDCLSAGGRVYFKSPRAIAVCLGYQPPYFGEAVFPRALRSARDSPVVHPYKPPVSRRWPSTREVESKRPGPARPIPPWNRPSDLRVRAPQG